MGFLTVMGFRSYIPIEHEAVATSLLGQVHRAICLLHLFLGILLPTDGIYANANARGRGCEDFMTLRYGEDYLAPR